MKSNHERILGPTRYTVFGSVIGRDTTQREGLCKGQYIREVFLLVWPADVPSSNDFAVRCILKD